MKEVWKTFWETLAAMFLIALLFHIEIILFFLIALYLYQFTF